MQSPFYVLDDEPSQHEEGLGPILRPTSGVQREGKSYTSPLRFVHRSSAQAVSGTRARAERRAARRRSPSASSDDSLQSRLTARPKMSRKQKRAAHEEFVKRELANLHTMDDDEIRNIFAVEWNPTFSLIFEDEQVWSRFREPSEEDTDMMPTTSTSTAAKHEEYDCHRLFRRIDRRVRSLLRKGVAREFMIGLEREITAVLDTDPSRTDLVFKFDNSFQRLLCHCLCKYYQIHSQSLQIPAGRVTVVRLRKLVPHPDGGEGELRAMYVAPPLSLEQYIEEEMDGYASE
eukprot:CAMPEP_0113908486 /NCGR_PEP_ID=MMETSP0780_2-20120614/26191_1 /TAXON_ID=652834 /ORGANISM="Palpitomonas bilix" /LENGTH=288 /DNA_ID=CAMNT_0000903925 /DNA_START=149 /DNA_END=1015 /DNA_ORIENTATION=+ /assembly_acc=CAM_ASM_000599